jgi:hypothetical protein
MAGTAISNVIKQKAQPNSKTRSQACRNTGVFVVGSDIVFIFAGELAKPGATQIY